MAASVSNVSPPRPEIPPPIDLQAYLDKQDQPKPEKTASPLGAPDIADTHTGRRIPEANSFGLWYYGNRDNDGEEGNGTNPIIFLPALISHPRVSHPRGPGKKVPRFRLPGEEIADQEIPILKPGIKAALAIELLTNPAPLMVLVHELLNQPEGITTYNSKTVRTLTQDKKIPLSFNIAISIMGPAHSGKSSIATLLNREHHVPIVPLDRSNVAYQYKDQTGPPFIEDPAKKRTCSPANYQTAAIAAKLHRVATHRDAPILVLDTGGFVINNNTDEGGNETQLARPDNPLAALARSADIIALATESASSEPVEGEPPRLFLDTPEGRERIEALLEQNPGLAIPVATRQFLPIFTSGDLNKNADRFMQMLEDNKELIQHWQFTRRLEWALLLVESIESTGLKNALRRRIKQFLAESPHKLDIHEKLDFNLAFPSFPI